MIIFRVGCFIVVASSQCILLYQSYYMDYFPSFFSNSVDPDLQLIRLVGELVCYFACLKETFPAYVFLHSLV